MKLRAMLIATAAAAGCLLAFAGPALSQSKNSDAKRYTIFVVPLPKDACDFSKGEYWLKPPERNGPFWETFCRDMDEFGSSGEKWIKRNFWSQYPNGDPTFLHSTYGYDCDNPSDQFELNQEGVYSNGCLGTW